MRGFSSKPERKFSA